RFDALRQRLAPTLLRKQRRGEQTVEDRDERGVVAGRQLFAPRQFLLRRSLLLNRARALLRRIRFLCAHLFLIRDRQTIRRQKIDLSQTVSYLAVRFCLANLSNSHETGNASL